MAYILPLLIVVLDIALIVKIARSDEPAKLPWIMLIIFVPILGPLVYIGVKTKGEPLIRHQRSQGAEFQGRV